MKKGDLSLNYVVIAAIALVVLVVIILFFMGGLQKLVGEQAKVVKGTVPDWQIKAWSGRCQLACSTKNDKDYCETKFGFDIDEDGKSDVYYACNKGNTRTDAGEDLKVGCDDIKCR